MLQPTAGLQHHSTQLRLSSAVDHSADVIWRAAQCILPLTTFLPLWYCFVFLQAAYAEAITRPAAQAALL
jgi:hypothetical protein